MPSGPTSSSRRPPDLRVLHHHRTGLPHTIEALPDDPKRLPHLLDPDLEPGEAVGAVPGGDVEVVGLVAGVGLVLAEVPGHAGGAEHRAGDAQRQGSAGRQDTDAPVPLRSRSGSSVSSVSYSSIRPGITSRKSPDLRCAPSVGDVHDHAADPDVRVVHAQAGDRSRRCR